MVAEVLGFRGLEKVDAEYFERLFAVSVNCQLDDVVTKATIELRRNYNVQLPDAIIAATAMVNDLSLWTHNTEDFEKISGLRLSDPLVV